MTRRDLIQKVLIGGTTFLILPPVLCSCSKDDGNDNGNGGPTEPKTITLDLTNASNASLNTVGGYVITQGIIVANTSAGYRALDSVCTHQGNQITYNLAAHNFPCSRQEEGHGSVYSPTGSVIAGPAPASLKSYAVAKNGNILTITL
ncbi:MAG: Rieske 2Fe-2S domain-containing protein [Bacteroidales bacterium]|nr:Rieske 2Fe-2S domain-containing protein [Bacteroidales bacterium]